MRGPAGEFPLDEQTIFIAGKSLARQFREKLGREARFVTGRDTRESGEWIERAFHGGAKTEGAHCESAEVITTPGVAFLTKKFNFDAGIVVSASHNPYYDNGIKIFSPSGKKIDGETEREIEKDIFDKEKVKSKKQKAEEIDVSNSRKYQEAYLDYLAGEFENLSLANFKIVMDCANGAVSNLAPKLLEKFGAEVLAFNCEPDGKNINANCGSTHLEDLFRDNEFENSFLRKKIIDEKVEFGVAFDGDADRALFVDEKGNFVDGDAVLWIMALHFRRHGTLLNGKVISTVMSNKGLEIALKSRNIDLLCTDVGDKYVLEELLKTNSVIGGEQSGHIIFPTRSLVGDGMLTTLFLLEALQENQKTLSELTEGFTRFPQTLKGVKVRHKNRPLEEIPELAEARQEIEKELGDRGKLNLRYSGTESKARIMIQGENQSEIEAQADRLVEIIAKNLG